MCLEDSPAHRKGLAPNDALLPVRQRGPPEKSVHLPEPAGQESLA